MISIWKKNMKENFRISHFCDIFAKKIMTNQSDKTSNDRKFSGFGQNDFTVSRNWGGRHPQNDQILKRPRKSTSLILLVISWKFGEKILREKKVMSKNMMGRESALSRPNPLWMGYRTLSVKSHVFPKSVRLNKCKVTCFFKTQISLSVTFGR